MDRLLCNHPHKNNCQPSNEHSNFGSECRFSCSLRILHTLNCFPHLAHGKGPLGFAADAFALAVGGTLAGGGAAGDDRPSAAAGLASPTSSAFCSADSGGGGTEGGDGFLTLVRLDDVTDDDGSLSSSCWSSCSSFTSTLLARRRVEAGSVSPFNRRRSSSGLRLFPPL